VGEEAAQVFGLSVYRSYTHKRSNGTFVCFFFVLFLSNKEKGHRFSLIHKGKRIASFADGRKIEILLTPHPSLRDTFSLWRRLM